MFFVKSQYCMNLYFHVSQKNLIIIMIYFRCVRNKKKCRFFLFKKYTKYIRIDKKCEFTMITINFLNIDRIITKLEKKIEN